MREQWAWAYGWWFSGNLKPICLLNHDDDDDGKWLFENVFDGATAAYCNGYCCLVVCMDNITPNSANVFWKCRTRTNTFHNSHSVHSNQVPDLQGTKITCMYRNYVGMIMIMCTVCLCTVKSGCCYCLMTTMMMSLYNRFDSIALYFIHGKFRAAENISIIRFNLPG